MIPRPVLVDAIHALRPNARWELNGYEYADLRWIDTDSVQPSEDEVTAYIAANAYKRARAAEYPAIADLADALVHQANGDPAPMAAYIVACDAVKTKYPKGA